MAGSGNPELQRLLATLNSYAPRFQPTASLERQQQEESSTQTTQGNLNLTSRKRPHESSSQWPTTPTPTPAAAAAAAAAASAAIPGLGMIPSPAPALATAPAPALAAPVTTTNPSSSISSSTNRLPPGSTTPNNPAPSSSTTPTIPDASRIITYPAALKHVTKYLATSDTISTRIRHLISTQHQHERQWHSGREALVALHESRRSTSAQVSALLRSLGGKDTTATTTASNSNSNNNNNNNNNSSSSSEATNKAELAAYDAKVYRSLVAMQADFDRQLRSLGVPFFAISHDLVIKDGERIVDTHAGTGTRQKIDKGELRELQKRMLALLEDLFTD